MMTVLAHAGHWATPIAVVVPLLAVGAWIAVTTVRDRRRKRRPE
jgi:hypothetical protein